MDNLLPLLAQAESVGFSEKLSEWIATAVGYVWNLPLIIMLVGSGMLLSFLVLGGSLIQWKGFRHAIDVVRGKFDHEGDPGEISHFAALCTALSATVGLGNIGGVAVAMHLGGPGAVFWMILVGVFGMALKFSECTLAVKYRRVDEAGVVHGGPMHYIEQGLGKTWKPLAIFYAIGIMVSSWGAGNMFQTNQVAAILDHSMHDYSLSVVGTQADIPTEGRKSIIVASEGGTNHFRIFDALNVQILDRAVTENSPDAAGLPALTEKATTFTEAEAARKQAQTALINSIAAITSLPNDTEIQEYGLQIVKVAGADEVPEKAKEAIVIASSEENVFLRVFDAEEKQLTDHKVATGSGEAATLKSGITKLGRAETVENEAKISAIDSVTAVVGHARFHIPKVVTGLALAFFTGLVIIGGIKRIGSVTSKLVPFMGIIYVGGALVVIFTNLGQIPGLLKMILHDAFAGTAAAGGFAGIVVKEVIIQGVRRASFSNEAGMGSAAVAHSAAATKEPVREGVVALLEPFIDTVVICTMTALVILISGAWTSDANAVELTAMAFDSAFQGFGKYFIPVAVTLFAYSTLLSWAYYGERGADYLFGERGVLPFKLVFCGFAVLGAIRTLDTVLNFSDLVFGLLAIPNILAIWLLFPVLRKESISYFERLKAGEFKRKD